MDIVIRKEMETDWYNAEYITKKAFWNLHVPGCDEHYLVHKLRIDDAYIPELTYVAEVNKRIVGAIYYSKAEINDGVNKTDIVTFGPLCVDPEFQKMGVGGKLLEETMLRAKELGYKAIIIFGDPEYYPRHGFVTCDHFNITTQDEKNFDAFMGIELVKAGLVGVTGKFSVAEVFYNLPADEVAEYDKKFPYMEKLTLPGQWIKD